MTKSVYWGSLLIIAALVAGSLWMPNSFVMTFVSTSTTMVVARLVLAAMMVALIVTNPPRSHALRATLAVASAFFAAWAIQYSLSGTIALADAVLFLHASISFALAALESGGRKILVEDQDSDSHEVPISLVTAATRGM